MAENSTNVLSYSAETLKSKMGLTGLKLKLSSMQNSFLKALKKNFFLDLPSFLMLPTLIVCGCLPSSSPEMTG